MDALALQTYLEPNTDSNIETLLQGKNTSVQAMWRLPNSSDYYRVSAFNRQGLFFSNRVESSQLLTLTQSEIAETVDSFTWLEKADAVPFSYVLISPHPDPWPDGQAVSTFGVGRAILWNGLPVGYLQVQMAAAYLGEVFLPEGLDSVQVCAFVNDMEPLYESTPGCFDTALSYINGNLYKQKDHYTSILESEETGLLIYISQDTALWDLSLLKTILQSVLLSLFILLIAVIVIYLVSRRITKSIRQLQKSILDTSFDGLTLSAYDSKLKNSDEVYVIEQAYVQLVQRLNQAIYNETKLRESQLQAQMNALQAQINPHFIYNTLNVISSKGLEHKVLDIVDICEHFSKMLRYSSETSCQTATLQKELAHTASYLQLMKFRYTDRLKYTIDAEERLYDFSLPKLVIQPLVENCISHGYKNNLREMQISVVCCSCEDGILIKISDSGDGFPEEIQKELMISIEELKNGHPEAISFSSALGMKNTFTRLYLQAQGRLDIRLYNDNGANIELIFR